MTPGLGQCLDHARPERLLGEVLLFGDLKRTVEHDPCRRITQPWDLEKLPESSRLSASEYEPYTAHTSIAFEVQGQFISHADAICSDSPRFFVLGFVIFSDYARLLRFDNAGVIYSELFEWKTTDFLAHTVQRLTPASNSRCGIDTSAVRTPTTSEYVAQAKAIFDTAKKADMLPSTITWDRTFCATDAADSFYWLFNVYDEHLKRFHRVLTYREHVAPMYCGGRATRGYIGVDLDEGCVVYMKRSWRIHDREGIKERDLYRQLEEANVRHLPDCYFGGDVPLRTADLVHDYQAHQDSDRPWAPKKKVASLHTQSAQWEYELRPQHGSAKPNVLGQQIAMHCHVLHVTLFSKIGSRLQEFSRSRDLCQAVHDAIEST